MARFLNVAVSVCNRIGVTAYIRREGGLAAFCGVLGLLHAVAARAFARLKKQDQRAPIAADCLAVERLFACINRR